MSQALRTMRRSRRGHPRRLAEGGRMPLEGEVKLIVGKDAAPCGWVPAGSL